MSNSETKFCQHCGKEINKKAKICVNCGCEVENSDKQIIINNTNNNTLNGNSRLKNKWISFFLCLFLGMFGAHKFYEGKILLGILYMFTMGLAFIGWAIDLVILLFKPNPYSV